VRSPACNRPLFSRAMLFIPLTVLILFIFKSVSARVACVSDQTFEAFPHVQYFTKHATCAVSRYRVVPTPTPGTNLSH